MDPRLSSSRIALISLLLFSFIFFQFYSSFIVGSLLTKPVKSLRTIDQLFESNIECGLDSLPYHKNMYENSVGNIMALKLYYTKIAPKNNYFKLRDGIGRVKQGGFAYNTDFSSGYMIVKGNCNANML